MKAESPGSRKSFVSLAIRNFWPGPVHFRYYDDSSGGMLSAGGDSSPNNTRSLVNSTKGHEEGSRSED